MYYSLCLPLDVRSMYSYAASGVREGCHAASGVGEGCHAASGGTEAE